MRLSQIVERLAGSQVRAVLRKIKERLIYFKRCQEVKPRLMWYHIVAARTKRVGTTGRKDPNCVIVSFTSYPARMRLKGVVEGTALSLLRQTVKPDRLILWLARQDFPNGIVDVPKGLVALQRCGLEIMFCEEMRSYKKLIPTLSEWPNATVITADDDVFYPKRWLEGLLAAHKTYPKDVVAYIGRRIALTGRDFAPYKTWRMAGFGGCTCLNLQTGVGGVVYPAGSWDERILDYALAKRLAPSNDDLPFHLFCTLKGSKIRAIKLPTPIVDLIPDMEAAPHLCSENVVQEKNDVFMRTIAKEYPEYVELLLKEKSEFD